MLLMALNLLACGAEVVVAVHMISDEPALRS